MSAATAPSGSPRVTRSRSDARNHGSYSPSTNQPTRTRSSGQRPTASSNRSNSRSKQHDMPPASNPTALTHVARHDFETTNVARPSSSSRRNSRDGRSEQANDVSRNHARPTTSRSRSRRNSADLTAPTAVVGNGATAAPPPPPYNQSERASSSAYPAAPPTGRRRTSITTQTGTWALQKTIGQGSMGKVKLARNIETGEQVAIKIVPRQSLDDHGNPRDERADRSKEIRTAREAAMVTLLNHPFICAMRDVQRTNYHWYMLFEYVNGGQMLDYIISHGRLKEKQARKFARQIASALDYCHRNSIVHRDLKIENILISKTGDIKIIDFGLSNLYSPRALLKTFCGSLYFAAPELLQARQYTGPEVDVWSFGIVLYVLVCGKVPFDDQSMPQLHAKIKRGQVDYPSWISSDCRNIISRMLVVDPKERASLQEVMNHPWMTKGFNTPPENYLPHREPLQLPLEPEVIEKMQGFDFGSAAYITEQLTRILESEEYQSAVRRASKEDSAANTSNDKKRGVFDFYKRRNSTSREGLMAPSSEAIRIFDPLNAYSPLFSIYYLAREKRDRERLEANPGAISLPLNSSDVPLRMPGLPPPEAAHTNDNTYEMPGENATGGRSRPRARTHGEDEIADGVQRLDLAGTKHIQGSTSPSVPAPPPEQPGRKEGTAMGILRRFSTRKTRDRNTAEGSYTPTLNIQPPPDSAAPPRKSFSVRRARRHDQSPTKIPSGGSQPQHEGLLSAAAAEVSSRANKMLGRSTSVNSADYRPRRFANRTFTEAAESPRLAPEPPATSGSDRSETAVLKTAEPTEPAPASTTPATTPRTPTSGRTRSLGHARQESIQARRQRREEARRDRTANVPEETEAELREGADGADLGTTPDTPGAEVSKPIYLKGLFSVSTTSSKPVQFIRHDIIRVLKQLGVDYTEIKGGFSCRHAPSINLQDVREGAGSMEEEKSGRVASGHQRRISFGGFRTRDKEDNREEKPHRHSSRRGPPDRSFVTNSEGSDEYVGQSTRNAGEGMRDNAATTTRVQTDTGEHLVLRFEIAIVKIPLLGLHGIQFKKIQGGMNQYKQMSGRILDSLRL